MWDLVALELAAAVAAETEMQLRDRVPDLPSLSSNYLTDHSWVESLPGYACLQPVDSSY